MIKFYEMINSIEMKQMRFETSGSEGRVCVIYMSDQPEKRFAYGCHVC
jgi:hypothetical protein